jgi:hypothetical protein
MQEACSLYDQASLVCALVAAGCASRMLKQVSRLAAVRADASVAGPALAQSFAAIRKKGADLSESSVRLMTEAPRGARSQIVAAL